MIPLAETSLVGSSPSIIKSSTIGKQRYHVEIYHSPVSPPELDVHMDKAARQIMEANCGTKQTDAYIDDVRKRFAEVFEQQIGGEDHFDNLMLEHDGIFDGRSPEVANTKISKALSSTFQQLDKEFGSRLSLQSAVEVTENMLSQAIANVAEDNVGKSLSEMTGEIFRDLQRQAGKGRGA